MRTFQWQASSQADDVSQKDAAALAAQERAALDAYVYERPARREPRVVMAMEVDSDPDDDMSVASDSETGWYLDRRREPRQKRFVSFAEQFALGSRVAVENQAAGLDVSADRPAHDRLLALVRLRIVLFFVTLND